MLKEKALEAVKKVKIQPASAVKSFQVKSDSLCYLAELTFISYFLAWQISLLLFENFGRNKTSKAQKEIIFYLL